MSCLFYGDVTMIPDAPWIRETEATGYCSSGWWNTPPEDEEEDDE